MSRRIVLLDIGNALTLRGVLPSAALHNAYSAKLTASGGVAPYHYAVVDGALPDGLWLDATTGTVSGTTSQGGRFLVTVEASDATGAKVRRTWVVAVKAEPMTISGTYPNGVVGESYSADLSVSGGVPPYSDPRVTSGSLPPGLALSIIDDELRLSGVPASSDSFRFSVSIDDSASATTTTTVDISIAEATQTMWDMFRFGTGIVIVDGGKTAGTTGENGSQPGYAVSASGKSSGKFYAELEASGFGAGFDAVRIGVFVGGARSLDLELGEDDSSVRSDNTSSGSSHRHIVRNGLTLYEISCPTLFADQTVRIAVDASSGHVWLSYLGLKSPSGSNADCSFWVGGGDPATGADPTTSFAPSEMYIAARPSDDAVHVTWRDPESWLFTAPAGFGVWT